MLQCVSVVTVALSAFVCQWSLLVCLLCVSVIIAGLSVFIGVSGLCWLSELCVSVVTVGLICVFQSVLLVCLLCVFQWLLVVRLQHVLSLHALLTRALLNFEGTLYKLFQKLSLMYAYFVFSLRKCVLFLGGDSMFTVCFFVPGITPSSLKSWRRILK